MKKYLMILSCLFCVQNAWCDIPPEFMGSIYDFMDEKMEEDDIRELCRSLMNYAWIHSVNVNIDLKDGGVYKASINDCTKLSIGDAKTVLMAAALRLKEESFKEHSSCVQNLMMDKADEGCEGWTSSKIEYYEKRGGYEFDFNDTIVECSKTDNRCVVNRPFKSKDGQSGFYSVCCLVPVKECNETVRNIEGGTSRSVTGSIGYLSVLWSGIVGNSKKLNDFGYDCKPLN